MKASSSSDQTGSQLLKALGAKTTLTGRGAQQVGAVPHTSPLTGRGAHQVMGVVLHAPPLIYGARGAKTILTGQGAQQVRVLHGLASLLTGRETWYFLDIVLPCVPLVNVVYRLISPRPLPPLLPPPTCLPSAKGAVPHRRDRSESGFRPFTSCPPLPPPLCPPSAKGAVSHSTAGPLRIRIPPLPQPL